MLAILKKVKKEGNTETKLVDDRLFLNGYLQNEYLPSSLPQEVAVDVKGIRVKESDPVEEEDNMFSGFSASVSSLRDERRVADKLPQSPSVARCSHFIYAYRISKEQDCDHGAGLELLKTMEKMNIVNTLFISTTGCHQNFKHIGQKGFDHAITTCLEAYGQ